MPTILLISDDRGLQDELAKSIADWFSAEIVPSIEAGQTRLEFLSSDHVGVLLDFALRNSWNNHLANLKREGVILIEAVSKMVRIGHAPGRRMTNGLERRAMGYFGTLYSGQRSPSRWQRSTQTGQSRRAGWDFVDLANRCSVAGPTGPISFSGHLPPPLPGVAQGRRAGGGIKSTGKGFEGAWQVGPL